MKQKTKPKNQKIKKPEMVRKSELLKLESYLEESNQLVESLRKETKARQEYDENRISQLENDLANAYNEQQRLFTVVSTLGCYIQNLEQQTNLNNNLNATETPNQLTDRRREF